MTQPELTARKFGGYIQVSADYLRMVEEDLKAERDAAARWAAMTPAERDAATAEYEARRAADKEARTCKACGCDPDEHGSY